MPQESTIEEVMYKINLTAQVLKGMHNYPNKMLPPERLLEIFKANYN